MGRASLRVLSSKTAVRGWVPRTVDVCTAFIQGLPLNRIAPVYVQPPPQARAVPGTAWRQRKCAYGLTESSPALIVLNLTIRLGYLRVETDHAVLVLVLSGVPMFSAAVHVDDFKYGGVAKKVARFETAHRAAFDVGPVHVGNFTLMGLRITCDTDESSGKMVIVTDEDHYLMCTEEIDITAERAASRSVSVSTSELTSYVRAVGALLWASGQTQPLMACHSTLRARRFHKAVVNDLHAVNRVFRAAQASRGISLLSTAVVMPHRIVLFSDGSSIAASSASAQTGYLLFLASDVLMRGSLSPETPLVLLACGSHKQRRVTHV